MLSYPPPIFALDSSFPSPGLLCTTQDTPIDNVMPVDNLTPAPPPNKLLQSLSNPPGSSYNVDNSSGCPLKAKNSKKIRSSISKGVFRKSTRRMKCKFYPKSKHTYSKHLPSGRLKFAAMNIFRSPHTSATTPTAASVQTLQFLAYPSAGTSELNPTIGNPGTPLVDANLDFSGFEFTGIDIDELSAVFDTAESQALAPPDDFDFYDFDFTGILDHADHLSSSQDTNEGEIPEKFDLGGFDFDGMLDTPALDVDSQAPGSSHPEDQWNNPGLASSIDAVLTIGTGALSIESSVKGLYYPGSNVFVPINLNVF